MGAHIMSVLDQITPVDNEQKFIDEIMNKKPLFKSNKDAVEFYSVKLEMIAKEMGLSVKDLIIKADSNGKLSQLEELALEINLRLNAFRKSL